MSHAAAPVWKPGSDGTSTDERCNTQHEEAQPPAKIVRQYSSRNTAEKAAEGGSTDVEAHNECDPIGRPLLANISDNDSNNSGHHQSLEKTPKDQLRKGGRCGRKESGESNAENGKHDDTLAGHVLRQNSEDGG